MKKKTPLRWDKIIAMITLVLLVIFAVIIYKDLHPSKKEAKETGNESIKSKTVCIDPGHGGNDCGAEYKGKQEKKQTLEVALLVKKHLEEKGVNVIITRTGDETVELEERVKKSNDANALAFVSIHRNDSDSRDGSVSGVEAWIHSSKPADSVTLAQSILNKIAGEAGVQNRGVKTGTMKNPSTNYLVNSKSAAASCIIELGFIKNSKDEALVEKNKDKTAKAISDGIIEYINGK